MPALSTGYPVTSRPLDFGFGGATHNAMATAMRLSCRPKAGSLGWNRGGDQRVGRFRSATATLHPPWPLATFAMLADDALHRHRCDNYTRVGRSSDPKCYRSPRSLPPAIWNDCARARDYFYEPTDDFSERLVGFVVIYEKIFSRSANARGV